jgi:hypothetical protein
MAAIFVVPVPESAVQQAINEAYPLVFPKPTLLPVPDSLNFEIGMHPILVVSGVNNDIRQSSLYIDQPLRTTGVFAPFTSTGKSDTAFSAPLVSYLAGSDKTKNTILPALVPALVATLAGGLTSGIGDFLPVDAAWESGPTNPDGTLLYSSKTKQVVFANPISGPGIYPAVVDMLFSDESMPRYSLKQVLEMINQPYILNTPFNAVPSALPGLPGGIMTCMRNTYYFTNKTAQVQPRFGNVTLGPSAAAFRTGFFPGTLQKASPDMVGDYLGVHGFSGCAQLVGYNTVGGQDCEEAAKVVDPLTS